MKAKALLLIAVSLIALCSATSDVVTLTSDNFDEQIKQGGVWFVEFYAPWCGHCKKLTPTWESLATELKGKVHVGKVDCTEQTALGERFGIRGYPTLKVIDSGKVYTYLSDRSQEALKAFAEGGYLTTGHPPLDFPESKEAPKPAKPAAVPPSGEVVVLTEANFNEKTASGEWLLEFYAPWCGHCKKLEPTYKELAAKLEGKVNVAKIDCTEHKNLATRFGIRGFPTIKYLRDDKLYDYASARSLEAFVEFVEGGYKEAASNPIPAEVAPAAKPAESEKAADGSSPVVKLTAANFDKLTATGKWFIKFYVPWCGHCKKLAPVWIDAAKSLEGDVNVAEINCQEEAEKPICGRYDVRGYPTIVYQEGDLYYEFEGERNIHTLTKFALVGYKTASSHFKRGAAGWQGMIADYIAEIESVIHINIWFGILICFLVGLLIGIMYMILTIPVEAPRVKAAAEAVVERVEDEAEEIVSEVKQKAGKAAKKVQQTAEDVQETTKKAAKAAGEKVEKVEKAAKAEAVKAEKAASSPSAGRKARTPKAD